MTLKDRTASRGTSAPHDPTPGGMSSLNREERHALLVIVLAHIAPWFTLVGAVGFLSWWIVSLTRPQSDDAALAMFVTFTLFTGYAWAVRHALLGPTRGTDPKP